MKASLARSADGTPEPLRAQLRSRSRSEARRRSTPSSASEESADTLGVETPTRGAPRGLGPDACGPLEHEQLGLPERAPHGVHLQAEDLEGRGAYDDGVLRLAEDHGHRPPLAH